MIVFVFIILNGNNNVKIKIIIGKKNVFIELFVLKSNYMGGLFDFIVLLIMFCLFIFYFYNVRVNMMMLIMVVIFYIIFVFVVIGNFLFFIIIFKICGVIMKSVVVCNNIVVKFIRFKMIIIGFFKKFMKLVLNVLLFNEMIL